MKRTTIIFALVALFSLVSLNLSAVKVVPVKSEFPNYSGYIVYPGTTQAIFREMIDEIVNDDDKDPNTSYKVDRENYAVTVTYTEIEDGMKMVMKMKLRASENRVNYNLTIRIFSDGEDVTEMFRDEMAEEMDQIVQMTLEELADELD